MAIGLPLISVIIPTYNRAPFVCEAIDSVFSQTFTDYEIIVVDDGSTDSTKEVLEKYQDKIKYIYQENSGVSAARNAGIKNSTGSWLAFLDSDDKWMPQYLSTQVEWVRRFPDICMQTTDCYCCRTASEENKRTYFEMNRVIKEFKRQDYLLLTDPFRFVVMHGPWQVGSTIFYRDAIKKAGLFDTNLGLNEDFDLMARMALQGPFGVIRNALVVMYRRNETIACLTSQVKTHPIQARELYEKIYEKLRSIETLKGLEREAVSRLMGMNRRAIGNLLLMTGSVDEARESYRQAFFIDRSLRSLGKYFLSFFPTNINQWIIEKRQ
ncbi:glycosyltransferase family 2 protein [Candidatus Methylomicrobium oryzae]|uniref:glycosyltransferase family 2 protein n=1 Tax=Candidatus Methylomicrobium oryzae TaxID=2802053 RepID=UPI001923E009|nr:glycosyltransferase family A protein [Methylomicrobium sp. RS1]MBL1264891.1 glycosyltransferase family 2 protein [Methylomicrobium sp. RS1]